MLLLIIVLNQNKINVTKTIVTSRTSIMGGIRGKDLPPAAPTDIYPSMLIKETSIMKNRGR